MKITSIKIKKFNNTDKAILGIASIQLDDCLIIHNIQIVQLSDKRILSFPSKKVKKCISDSEGYKEVFEYTDVVHPSNKEFREYIEIEIFKVFDSRTGESDNE